MSESLVDDRPRVSGAWITSFSLMYFGINIAWAAPAQLLIANQILEWNPGEKEALLATIMTAGGVLGLVASPIWGWVSDHTKSRFGPRAPWIMLSAITCAAALVGMAFASTFAMLLVLWCIFQTMIAAATNVSQAIPPDRVSRVQYGTVSALMGIGWTLAVVVGTLLGESLSIAGAYFASAGLLLALILPYLIWHNSATVLPTPSEVRAPSGEGVPSPVPLQEHGLVGPGHAQERAPADQAPAQEREPAVHAVAPAARPKYADFAWVFFSRMVVTLGNNVALFYLLYYLRDYIGLSDPDRGVLILTALYAAVTVVSALVSGKLSDVVGRRKPFVLASCLTVAFACLLMAVANSFAVVIGAAAVLGVGWGIFTAIDQALINQVLPKAQSRGRDIGIMSLAVAIPSMFAPAIAAMAVLNLGGYFGLYVISAALSVLGGISVLQVKGSR